MTENDQKRIKEIMDFNDRELNKLPIKEAIKYDHRSYIQYYISLLKMKPLLFKFMTLNDYDSRMIKIYLCFYNFISNYTVNALFFKDDTMHKIYLARGYFNFIYQLPQIIYSAVISFIFFHRKEVFCYL